MSSLLHLVAIMTGGAGGYQEASEDNAANGNSST